MKVQNNVNICEGEECEDDVFLGSSMVFTHVMNSRSHVSRQHEYRRTLVRRGANIGAKGRSCVPRRRRVRIRGGRYRDPEQGAGVRTRGGSSCSAHQLDVRCGERLDGAPSQSPLDQSTCPSCRTHLRVVDGEAGAETAGWPTAPARALV